MRADGALRAWAAQRLPPSQRVAFAEDGDPQVRALAIGAIPLLAPAGHEALLLRAAGDPAREVRRRALRRLLHCPRSRERDRAMRRAAADADAAVRLIASAALVLDAVVPDPADVTTLAAAICAAPWPELECPATAQALHLLGQRAGYARFLQLALRRRGRIAAGGAALDEAAIAAACGSAWRAVRRDVASIATSPAARAALHEARRRDAELGARTLGLDRARIRLDAQPTPQQGGFD